MQISDKVGKALARLPRYEDWITDRHAEICAIPAPSFEEQPRANHMKRLFERLKLKHARLDAESNAVAELPGAGPGVVAITAHLDTVFPRNTLIEIRREKGRLYGPGVADNGTGLAALAALARVLGESKIRTRDTLLFVANVGEEGVGNLRGMKHLLADAALRERVRAILVVDGPGHEHVVTEGLGSRRFEVVFDGPGGHSWRDFGTVNPIHAMSAAVSRIAALPLASEPRTACSVTECRAGTSVNSIPTSASMKVDIRSGSEPEMARLAARVAGIVNIAASEETVRAGRGQLTCTINDIGHRPAASLPPGARILGVIREVDRELGITSRLEQSSTDANVPLAMGLEAVCIGGGGSGGGTHSMSEWYDPTGRELGLRRLLLAALELAGVAD
jgi:acetylornithine deacetylase/succinyl-diaminopimelate desuccinylase-like protein